MVTDQTKSPPAQDRRVRRSRSALIRAAVTLVAERGTTAVPISDIAEAADVSRQLVYQQFGDRDALLLEAALEVAQTELMPALVGAPHPMTARSRSLAMARHFAEHREFYRAMLTGSCAFALNKALTGLILPVNERFIQRMSDDQLDPHTVEDIATFLTGGAAAMFNTWVVEGEGPLDPEEFADRLMRMASVILTAMHLPLRSPRTRSGPDEADQPSDSTPLETLTAVDQGSGARAGYSGSDAGRRRAPG